MNLEQQQREDAINSKLVAKAANSAADCVDRIEEMVSEFRSISEVLDYSVKHFRGEWDSINTDGVKLVNEVRSIRMSLKTETQEIVRTLKDIDDFMAGDGILRMKRLAELVELCERFQKVQESGSFDKIMAMLLAKA